MRRLLAATVVATLALAPRPSAGASPTTPGTGLARAIVERLRSTAAIRPKIHTTDFAGQQIGCITFTRREMRRFGYPGHAFFCEEATTAEILGAVLNRSGKPLCYITGVYSGEGCYDFDICERPDRFCVVE